MVAEGELDTFADCAKYAGGIKMRLKRINTDIIKFLVFAMVIYLIVAGAFGLFAAIYTATTLILVTQMWMSRNEWRNKILMTLLYLVILTVQYSFNTRIVYSGSQPFLLFTFEKFFSVLLILVPFFALYLNDLYAMQRRFFPAMQDAAAVSFEAVKIAYSRAETLKTTVGKGRETIKLDTLKEVAKDIPRHSYTKYLNNRTLTEAYFRDCEASLQDEHLYIVISSTGSSGSELLSVFTRKDYNHVSLSFDRDLKTIISYNGGGSVNQPGLNREDLEFFHQKEDASMLVYRLKAPKEKKQIVIDKIREINENGSAYNLVGLITKVSVKPNIMFCSQFVYSVLKVAGLNYFTEKAASVRPTDLIEKDYYRKLEFCYAIKFNELSSSIPA